MTATELDPSRLEAFGERMGGLLNDALLALSISVGHQTGLFDTMAELPPSTSANIAKAADLQERYVRELLGALTTGGITTYDPDLETYLLPPEHAAFLTRAAGVNNLGSITQFVAMLGAVEEDIVRCCREGGGVPYDRFPTFHRILAEQTKDVIDATLLEGTLDLVPGLRERLEAGIDVADVGCGSGYAINVLARAFPQSRFTGFDFSEQAIEAARAQAEQWGLTNARFEVRDVTELDVDAGFDFVTTFDAVHDQADPAGVLAGIAASLRPDGVYLCVDIAASSHLEDNLDHPLGPVIYTISAFHCMTVSLALDGAGLGAAWGEQTAKAMLADAGFTSTETHRVEGDIINVFYVARKD
jgi:SAM-dependent methyltransferase